MAVDDTQGEPLNLKPLNHCSYGSAGTVAGMRTSDMASDPVGLTIVRVGATTMRAGAILRPCMHRQLA